MSNGLDSCGCFVCRFVITRMHEEMAALRRLLGIYEEALDEILDVDDGVAYSIAFEALYIGRGDEHDDTPPPYGNSDPGDETDA